MKKILLFILLFSITIFSNNINATDYNDKIIAIVNDKVILKSEIQNAIDYLSPEEITKEYSTLKENEVINKVLDKLIERNLLLQAASRFGIKISDIALENKISELARSRKMSVNDLRNAIISNGQDYTRYIEELREKMTIETLFVTQFYSRANVTEEEVENFIEREKINQFGNMDYDLLEFVIIDENKELKLNVLEQIYKDIKNIGFNETKNKFATINISVNNLGVVNQSKLPDLFIKALDNKLDDEYTDIITSSKGYHILKVVNTVNKSSTLINEYKVRHILLSPDIMTSDEEIRNKLISIRNEIKDLDDFILSAKKYSDDKVSGFKGGDLGYQRSNKLVSEFASVMEKIPLKKISDPFQTKFGWHILYVENVRTVDDTKTIVRNNIANAIRIDKATRDRDDWMAKLKDQAYIEIKEF